MRKVLLLCLAAAAACRAVGDAPNEADEQPLSVLFIGNSYTFVNDVPGLVANISASANLPIRPGQATAGGSSLFQHANTSLPNGRATLALLRSQRWDAVVLQDQSETPGGGKDTDAGLPVGEGRRRSTAALEDTFGPLLAKAGSHAVLYQTWGRKVSDPPNAECCGYSSFEKMSRLTAEGYTLYSQALRAAGVNVSTARCGDAWARLHTAAAPAPLDNSTIFSCLYNHGTPSSQAPPCLIDGMGLGGHPSPLGSYLNALVIFAQLFGRSPLGVWAPAAISTADKAAVQQAAAAVSRLKADDEQAGSKPNAVLIFLDDTGWGDLGANWDNATAGSPSETPHMNALAADGMRFTDGHAGASVCGPSRSAIMTGRLGIRNGITHNSGYKWLAGLPRSELTLGEMMKSGGYDTLMLGKCVLSPFSNNRRPLQACQSTTTKQHVSAQVAPRLPAGLPPIVPRFRRVLRPAVQQRCRLLGGHRMELGTVPQLQRVLSTRRAAGSAVQQQRAAAGALCWPGRHE